MQGIKFYPCDIQLHKIFYLYEDDFILLVRLFVSLFVSLLYFVLFCLFLFVSVSIGLLGNVVKNML